MIKSSGNSMIVSLEDFVSGRNNFQSRYYLAACNSDFGGQDIELSWAAFAGVISDFISNNSVAASSVALRFVYCYDGTGNTFYLRMQICTMSQDPTAQNVYNLNSSPVAWYVITNGSITSTTVTTTSDSAYLNNFYYCSSDSCSSQTLQKLGDAPSNYTQNIVFPWSAELNQMYIDNSSPTGATICFASCAYPSQSAATCSYPHNLVIYLRDHNGDAMMNNTKSSDFCMKGADCGTMCPSICDVYVTPPNQVSHPHHKPKCD
jgi:hypothetical protein